MTECYCDLRSSLVSKGMHDSFVELDELSEAYDERKIQGSNGNYYGPTISPKGYVSRLNKEPSDNEYDQTGSCIQTQRYQP